MEHDQNFLMTQVKPSIFSHCAHDYRNKKIIPHALFLPIFVYNTDGGNELARQLEDRLYRMLSLIMER